METYLTLSNHRVLSTFMSTATLNSSARHGEKFNVEESKSTKDLFYSFSLQLNRLPSGFWVNKNTTGFNFDAESAQKIFKSFYSDNERKANILLAVQDLESDAVFNVKQFIRLKTMLQEEIPESGITNPSEEIVESLYSEDKRKTNILLDKLFRENFNNTHIMVGVLHIISHFDYDLVTPEGPTMAIAALKHKDVEVMEYGVKCFENWRHKDGIGVLGQIKTDEPWLQNYINLVINDLKNT